MKKLDTPEIGDPSVSGSGGVSADGAGARCLARVPVGAAPPVVSVCSPPPAEPCDFGCAPGATLEPPPDVFPCGCWVRTCGVVVGSDGALATGEVGAGTDSAVVVVVVAGGGVGGASGAGVTDVVSVEVVGTADVDVSVEDVWPVEDGCEDPCSLALATAGASASASALEAASSRRIIGRMSGCAVIESAVIWRF